MSLRPRLARLLGLPLGELSPVLSLGLLYGVLGAANILGDTLVQAAFLARAGAERLPSMLTAKAILGPLLAYVYARVARDRPSRSMLVGLSLFAAVNAFAAQLVVVLGARGALAAYAAHELVTSVLTIHWGVYLLDHLGAAQARRGVGVVYASARGGAALVGLAVPGLTWAVGVPTAMNAVGGLYLLVAVLALRLSLPRASSDGRPSVAPPAADGAARRRGILLVFRSPLLAAIGVATGAMFFARFVLRYQQQSILDALPEATLAAYLGYYVVAANLVSAALQLFGTGRFLSRFSVNAANLLYSVVLSGMQAAMLGFGGLPAAFAARFTDGELKHAMRTPVAPLFYEPFGRADRAAARAFVLGVVTPVSLLLAAGGIEWLIKGAVAPAAVVGLGACALYVAASVWQNRAYTAASRDNLARHGGAESASEMSE